MGDEQLKSFEFEWVFVGIFEISPDLFILLSPFYFVQSLFFVVINNNVFEFVNKNLVLLYEAKTNCLLFHWLLLYQVNFDVLCWVLIYLTKNLPYFWILFYNRVYNFLVQNDNLFKTNLVEKITTIDLHRPLSDNQGLLPLLRIL